jgi:hypothetical protein
MSAFPPRLIRRRALLLLPVALFALALGCQSFHLLFKDKPEVKPTDRDPPVRPQPGAPCKYAFRVAPYVFLSDFEINPELPIFKELAGLRDQVYRELQLPPPGSNTVIQVYLFEDRDRFQAFMDAHHEGLPHRRAFFIKQQRLGVEEMLVYTFWGDRIQQDLRHELTHALLHSTLKNVPVWLDEGLAEYFELPPENRGVNRAHVENLRRPGAAKLDLARLEAFTDRDIEKMTAGDYREAWAWVHFLLRGHPEARTVLLTYLAQLRRDGNPGQLTPNLTRVLVRLDDLIDQHLAALDARRSTAAAGR